MYSNPASVNNPFSGQSAVINQPNVPLMPQWTPAVAQCIAGVTSDGNTNPSVGVFSSVTPISQHQFPHVSSGGTVYYGFLNHDASAENTYMYQQQPFAADPSNTLPSLYKDALKTLERMFGQPQNVITAHLDKLSSFPQLRMHNSENIISFSMTISSLVAVLRSLDYEEDLKNVSLLNQALSKIPPNMRES